MATGQWPTLADLTSRMDGAGKQRLIAEMLSQKIALTKDVPYIEASEIAGHSFAYRTSIPAGSWRRANQGVPYAKSTTDASAVAIASLEDYSQVDRWIAERSGDIDRFRENEDVSFIEGMGQTLEQTCWYGNSVANPAQFDGLSTFYNAIAGAQNGANVIDGLGRGSSNCSLWLICWSPRTIYGVYPRGSKAGLTMEDKADTVPGFDVLGNRFEAYTSWFRQQMAIVPEDWRWGARIANIDVTTAGLAGTNALDIFATNRQLEQLPPSLTEESSGGGELDAPTDPSPGVRPVYYCNRTLRRFMDIQGMRNRNVLLTINDYAGKPVTSLNGIPLRISDQLLITEGVVS
jgi:hypothetical protein